VLIGAAISAVTSIVVVLFGSSLMSIFTTDPEVIRIGARYLFIVGLFYVLFGTMFINNGVLRGAGDSMIPMINTVLALWVVRIPCAILFSGPMGMGTDGIWLSVPAGWAVGAAFSTIYYLSGRWKTKSLVRKSPRAGIL
jgi:Na+-driven multidrug efflux pump